MPRAVVVLLSLIVVAAASTTARAETGAPAGYEVAARADVYSGVEYVKLAKANRPVVAHVAHVLPGAPVDMRVVNARDRISTSPKELETTSSMCARVQCIVGVNGDFHRAGAPAGAVVVDGRMLRSPDPDRPQLTVTKGGRLVAGQFPWTGSLTAGNGAQISVGAVNAAPPANALAVYTPEYGTSTDVSLRTELVVKAPEPVGALNRPTELEVIGLRTGAGPIPADGAVLSGDGSAGQYLRDLWARRQPGVTPRARLLVGSPIDASMSLGVEPVVLRDGRRALPWRDPNVVNPRQPHTLVGWNKEGHTYLVAVDGRQAASDGVTMAEAADFLLGLGVTDAVSLDGGGGTTFVAGGSVWNRPSDNDPARPGAYDERSATNAFVLVSRPGAPPPPASPPPPAPGAGPVTAGPQPPVGGSVGGATIGSMPSPQDPAAPGVVGTVPVGPISGVGGQLAAGELPVGPSPAGSGIYFRSGTPAGVGRAAAPLEPDHPSLVARADAPSGPGGADPQGKGSDYLQETLSLAAALTDQVAEAAPVEDPKPNRLPAGAAFSGAALLSGLAERRRRRRRSSPLQ